MKLLLDENLSRRLVPFLLHDYPDSSHVCLMGLESALDAEVWQAAKDQDFVIVTRDADFEELSLVWGQPPKVIWLKTSNQSRAATLKVLLDNHSKITAALFGMDQACVEVSGQ
jgi:predicted nuclease of predicted toxin-antitoxin system